MKPNNTNLLSLWRTELFCESSCICFIFHRWKCSNQCIYSSYPGMCHSNRFDCILFAMTQTEMMIRPRLGFESAYCNSQTKREAALAWIYGTDSGNSRVQRSFTHFFWALSLSRYDENLPVSVEEESDWLKREAFLHPSSLPHIFQYIVFHPSPSGELCINRERKRERKRKKELQSEPLEGMPSWKVMKQNSLLDRIVGSTCFR